MGDSREWIPEQAVESLTVRRALQEFEDPIKLSTDLIKEALPIVTMRMTHLATQSMHDGVAFNAAKYIMDRALGDEGKGIALPDQKPAWDRIFDNVLVEVDNALKSGE